jgi:hypothetical protein
LRRRSVTLRMKCVTSRLLAVTLGVTACDGGADNAKEPTDSAKADRSRGLAGRERVGKCSQHPSPLARGRSREAAEGEGSAAQTANVAGRRWRGGPLSQPSPARGEGLHRRRQEGCIAASNRRRSRLRSADPDRITRDGQEEVQERRIRDEPRVGRGSAPHRRDRQDDDARFRMSSAFRPPRP